VLYTHLGVVDYKGERKTIRRTRTRRESKSDRGNPEGSGRRSTGTIIESNECSQRLRKVTSEAAITLHSKGSAKNCLERWERVIFTFFFKNLEQIEI